MRRSTQLARGAVSAVTALGILVVGAWADPARSSDQWPQPVMPAGVRLFSIAEHMTLNGLPIRLNGFVANRPPAELVAYFRRSIGEPQVENRLGPQTILGQARGRFYISIHIKPHGAGAQGTIAVSDLQAANDSREASDRDRERWLGRLPASTKLVSLTQATDGAKRSLHLVFTNHHDQATNAGHLRDLLRSEGLHVDVDNPVRAGSSAGAYFFSGPGKDAVATISRSGDGATSTVLSLVTTLTGTEP